ncbi:molybdenum cofactor guanylyltransferase [Telluribacter sp. SYSU D00476]|uniref:molybdenum cofactor guanylyltransferase n=1 Tax=Telluribacter sp. SYSU D00476 TaxID=2811430 RepID=UPI001FF23F0C|nr:molybdenum cofactor guanylyltransferase [Telluribacter sp. SYSU D00476]
MLHGLVLSGGESRRMGQDKGLLTTDQKPWVVQAARLLESLYLPVTVVVREAQLEPYSELVQPPIELVMDADLSIGGPLKGMLTVHQLYPNHDWLVLPCDMPDMTAGILSNLIDFYKANPDCTAWAFRDEARWQPLPGIYSAQLLSHLLEKLHKDELRQTGLKQILEEGYTGEMPVLEDFKPAFQNYNSPTDLEGRDQSW